MLRQPILNIPETVKQDTLAYRGKLKKFIMGDTSPMMFRAYRVPMGIYEQRTTGNFMVRIRIGAGLALPFQLQRIAELSKTYGNGILHITTRQDIQIHEINIKDTADVLEGLLEVALSSRGGGGNTVRNITACPEAGVCPNEEFDVAPYAIATAEYLLQDRSSFNLPRKYKIVFAGCSQDCAFACIADLGFFAHAKNGTKGFAVYAAGGLGPNPAVAVKVEDFINTEEIFEVAEAVKRLFDKHGDRTNKHKARLRYVLARLGTEEFTKLYQQERQALKTDGLPYEPPQIRDIASDYPVTDSPTNVRLWLKNGDIPADDLSKVAQLADRYGQGLIRTTQLQDLLITAVSQKDLDKINSELKNLSINVSPGGIGKIVACTGAATCKLGLCLSRNLADAISTKFSQTDLPDTVIRISGCPNSCGHHHIADIGLQGKAKRINGKLMPCYDVLIGAKTTETDAHLAKNIGTVPAKQIPDLLSEALTNGTLEKKRLKTLTAEYTVRNAFFNFIGRLLCALLKYHSKFDIIIFCGVYHICGISEIDCHAFFYKNVLSRLCSGNRMFGMQPGRRTDTDSLDVVPLNHFTPVIFNFTTVFCRKLLGAGPHNIRNDNYFPIRMFLYSSGMKCTYHTRPYYSKSKFLCHDSSEY